MILAHAQFVLCTPVDTFEFVRHVILEGGATAKETPVAEAEPDAIAESGPRPSVSIFRKTNYACAKIIAVRYLQLHVIAVALATPQFATVPNFVLYLSEFHCGINISARAHNLGFSLN